MEASQFIAFAQALAQVGMFSIFVLAIIEVIKDVSAKGVFRIFKEALGSLFGVKERSTGEKIKMSTETIKTLNFVVSLYLCAVFKYGVMVKILQVEEATEPGSLAAITDYIGTSAIVYYGADKLYDKLWKMFKKFREPHGQLNHERDFARERNLPKAIKEGAPDGNPG